MVTYQKINEAAKSYSVKKYQTTLEGWPNHVVMGNITPLAVNSQLPGSGIYDFIMHYTANGAALDGGEWEDAYIFATEARALVDRCAQIEEKQKIPCRPLLTLYTANLSGGWLQGSLTEMGADGIKGSSKALAQNLSLLVNSGYVFEKRLGKEKVYSSDNIKPGAIVLNPDFFSFLCQNSSDRTKVLNAKFNVNYVLGFLIDWLDNGSCSGEFLETWSPQSG